MNINPKYVIIGGVSVVSLAVGAAGGYALAAHRHSSKVDETLERELEGTKEYYENRLENLRAELSSIHVSPETLREQLENLDPTVVKLTEDAIESLKQYGSKNEPIVTTDPTDGLAQVRTAYNLLNKIPKVEQREGVVVIHEDTVGVVESNVFAGDIPEEPEDFDDFKANRDPTIPYVISEEEFLQNDLEHDQQTMTYFQDDDILADTRDQIVDDSDGIVGDDNLLKFGQGSKDHNLVYVRNERLGMDFEISRSTGSYAEEVHGFIKHSASSRKPYRFRGDDE